MVGRDPPGEYAGCYYPRFIAGSTTLSNHSFGLALDLNVPGNQRGTVGEIDREVVAIFKKWGFAWGGDWGYTDPMHFELGQIGVRARHRMGSVPPMRAAQVVTPTGPSAVEIRDVDEPTPGPDDVLVEVHRVGVSFPDLLLSKGEYQLKPEPPFTLGVDFAGNVVGGDGFAAGDRVAAGCRTAGRGAGRRPGDVHLPAS